MHYDYLSASDCITGKAKGFSFDNKGSAAGVATDSQYSHRYLPGFYSENADPTVRVDFEMFFNKTVKENDPDYKHDYEGADDMPAHLKASLLGSSVMIPVRNGQLALGTWQGIYLCEHRNFGGSRNLVITAWGQ